MHHKLTRHYTLRLHLKKSCASAITSPDLLATGKLVTRGCRHGRDPRLRFEAAGNLSMKNNTTELLRGFHRVGNVHQSLGLANRFTRQADLLEITHELRGRRKSMNAKEKRRGPINGTSSPASTSRAA